MKLKKKKVSKMGGGFTVYAKNFIHILLVF
jgi:hypothetical protein